MRKIFITFLTLGVIFSFTSVHAAEPAEAVAVSGTIQGTGKVNKVDAVAGIVNLRHEAIPALKWHAMTMDFKVTDRNVLAKIKRGQVVSFDLVKIESGELLISRIEPKE